LETIDFFYPPTAGYYKATEPASKESALNNAFNQFLQEKRGYSLNAKLTVWAKFLTPYFQMRADIAAIPSYVPNGRLLDIGCSYGKYLLQMATWGWETYGVEPHGEAAEAARQCGAGTIHTGTLDNAPWTDGFFDVIVMNMSLEHCHNPLEVLKKASALLRDNGICIIAVPDFSGFEACFFKDKAYTLQVPQHLYHFTPNTLAALAQQAGMTCTRLRHHYFDRDLVAPLADAGYMKAQSLLTKSAIRKCLVKPAMMLCAALNLTSRMTAFFEKNKHTV
jgi:SAM-dependent methyltransferase